MKRDSNIIWGFLLIVLGLLFFINRFYNLNFLRVTNLWPIFVLIPGLFFELSFFFSKAEPGVLVPGGILTAIGLLFFFETTTGWAFSAYTWPFYPLAVAIGLFQLYIFGRKEPGLLIPVGILGGVSLVSFSILFFGKAVSSLIFPIILIALGILIVFRNYKK